MNTMNQYIYVAADCQELKPLVKRFKKAVKSKGFVVGHYVKQMVEREIAMLEAGEKPAPKQEKPRKKA
jgi:mannitol/fructose-specific phosphotransferase system IIA component